MIGLAGAIGSLDKGKNYNLAYSTIHNVDGVRIASHDFSDPHCAISLITREDIAQAGFKNAFYEDAKYIVFIEGFIYGEKNTPIYDELNDAKYVLNGWKNKGSRFIASLNGEYNIAIYDKSSLKLFLINDRFASRPLYYMKKKKTLFFGSEKKAIFCVMGKIPTFSNIGVMEFFALSHNTGQRTMFDNIYALPPASMISFSNNNLKIEKYWELEFHANESKLKQKEIIKQMAFLLHQAGEKKYCNRQKLGLGLSGGLDSRLVAATIPQNMRPVLARTYGYADSLEVRAAKEIAKRLRFDHYIHEPKKILFSSFLFPSVWRTEGSVHFTGLKSIVEHKNLKDRMSYNLNGHFGDVLAGKQLRPFMFSPCKRDVFIKKVYSHYVSYTYKHESSFQKIFNPIFFQTYFKEMQNEFNESFHKINGDNNWDIYDAWDLTNRQPRFTFCSSAVDNYLFNKIVIFTDYDYVDLMLSLPGHLRFGQSLYKKMIAIKFNKISDIPNSNTGKIIKSSTLGNLFDLALQYVSTKRSRHIGKGATDKATLIKKDLRLKSLMVSYIKGDAFPCDIFSRKGLFQVIEAHYTGNKNFSYLIGVFATFLAVHELFMLNRHTKMPEIAKPF